MILDANVLIAIADPADSRHADALRAVAAIPPGERLVHPVDFAEVLVGPAVRGLAAQAAADWVDVGVVVLSGDAVAPVDVANARARTGVRLPDAYALASAIGRHAPLMTFDRRLRAAATREGVTVVP
ncbi:MAG: PIN domain-containing protein [Propionibacteriaceae bacterium]|nr:PIN domain-containing protein [Propionibacteriaceae bacterium]